MPFRAQKDPLAQYLSHPVSKMHGNPSSNGHRCNKYTAKAYITVVSTLREIRLDRIKPRSKHWRAEEIASSIPQRTITIISLRGKIFATHLGNRGVFPRPKHAFLSSYQAFWKFLVKILVLFFNGQQIRLLQRTRISYFESVSHPMIKQKRPNTNLFFL